MSTGTIKVNGTFNQAKSGVWQLAGRLDAAGESEQLGGNLGSRLNWINPVTTLRGLLGMVFAHRRAVIFTVCCAFVALVSVHDAMLIVFNHEIIYEVEQNPVGRWLMEAQGGQIWLFVLVKLAGTAVVCAVLISLYRFRPRVALLVAVVMAGFQAGLLCYLTFA